MLRYDVLRVFVSFCVLVFVRALNLTYLHCLQHSLFEHLFNLCSNIFLNYITPLYWCIKIHCMYLKHTSLL